MRFNVSITAALLLAGCTLLVRAGPSAAGANGRKLHFKKKSPANMLAELDSMMKSARLARAEWLRAEMLEVEANFKHNDHDCSYWNRLEAEYREITGRNGPATVLFLAQCQSIASKETLAREHLAFISALSREQPHELEEFTSFIDGVHTIEEHADVLTDVYRDYDQLLDSDSSLRKLLLHIGALSEIIEHDDYGQDAEAHGREHEHEDAVEEEEADDDFDGDHEDEDEGAGEHGEPEHEQQAGGPAGVGGQQPRADTRAPVGSGAHEADEQAHSDFLRHQQASRESRIPLAPEEDDDDEVGGRANQLDAAAANPIERAQ